MQQNQVATTINRAVVTNTVFDLFVNNLATKTSENTPRTFDNFDTGCALSIMRAIALNAEKEIYIFTGNLDPRVYDDTLLVQSISNFASAGGIVNILIDDPVGLQNYEPQPLLYSLKNHININFKRTVKRLGFKHFMVADKLKYRLEIDPFLHRAIASFNDPEFASVLTSAHNKLWLSSIVIK